MAAPQVMVGSPPGAWADISVDGRLLFADRRLLGCMGGSNIPPSGDIPRIIELYRQGRIKLTELIGQRLALEDVNDAFVAMRTGDVARSVVTTPR